MNKRILITNDDGIDALGLRTLVMAARQFGDVTVIAPDSQRSASSHHCVFGKPLILKEYDMGIEGIKAFTCSGAPADCARVGILKLMYPKPDVMLSGINEGYNISSDIQYSGTVGAALEAIFNGVPAIAVSQGSFKNNEVVNHYLTDLLEEYLDKPLSDNQIWNINFPDCSLNECKGILHGRTVAMDKFYNDDFDVEDKGHGTYIYTNIVDRIWNASEGTDLHAIANNYISVGKVTNIT